jgi:hypothetical protein
MPDLFVTLASISPSASRVDGKNAERIAGVSPSMKDGVLAERSLAPTPSPLPGVVDGDTLSLWRFDEPSGVVAANSVSGLPYVTTSAELTEFATISTVNYNPGHFQPGNYVYDQWNNRYGQLVGPTDVASGLYIVPVPPAPFPIFPQWTTGPGQPTYGVTGPGNPGPIASAELNPPASWRMVVPDYEPPFLPGTSIQWAGGSFGVITTGYEPSGISSFWADGAPLGLHTLGTPTTYLTVAPSFTAPGANPTIGVAKFSNGRFFNGSTMWMDSTPTQYIRSQLRGDMTVEGWIYLDPAWASATATYQLGILSLQTTLVGPHTTTQPQFVIELCRVAPPSDPGQTVQALSFWWLGDDGTVHKKTNVPVTVPTGVWTHFAWRRRLRGGNWELSYFQNGAHIVTSSGVGDVVFGSTNKFRLGAGADTGAPTDNFFKGGLDDIRLSRCARSDQEILQAYRRGAG